MGTLVRDKFHRVYIELTNQCGLSCDFCPTKELPSGVMSLDMFDDILSQVSVYTDEIACHVMGDPFTLSNLDKYLDLIAEHGLKALLTTSGYYCKKQASATLFHEAVKQINISLNSYNKNDTPLSLDQYLAPILQICKTKQEHSPDIFINLRVWNLDEQMSERIFNAELFDALSSEFGVDLDIDKIYLDRPKSIRLGYKILLHFDTYFKWPSLLDITTSDGTCQGLSSHIAILSSGVVVPCCLDYAGVINLGNVREKSLDEILSSDRVKNIKSGFHSSCAVEELCQKCTYKSRFN